MKWIKFGQLTFLIVASGMLQLLVISLLLGDSQETMKPSDWAAVFSSLTAFFALIITGYTTFKLREHNKIVTRPYLELNRCANRENGVLDISITNAGFGPAICKKITLITKKNEVEYTPQQLARLVMSNRINPNGISYNTIIGESLLGHGDSVTLISLDSAQRSFDELLTFIRFEVGFQIDYESVYGEKYLIRSAPFEPEYYDLVSIVKELNWDPKTLKMD